MSENIVVLTGHSIGGGEKRLGRLAAYLASDSNYTLLTNATLVDSLDKQGIELSQLKSVVILPDIYPLIKKIPWLQPLQSLLLLVQLRHFFWNKKFGLVHFFGFHHGVFAKCVSSVKAKRIGYSVVSTRIIDEPRESGLYSRLSRISKHVDYFDCLSADIKKSVCSLFGLSDDRVFDAPCSFIEYKELTLPDKKNGVMFLARFEEIKNPLLFLKAVNLLNKSHPHLVRETDFEMYGHGSEEQNMRDYIKDNNLEEFVSVSFTNRPFDAFCKNKIYCSLAGEGGNYPSQSLIEAMYCKNGVIATNTGETHKIINENTGLLINLDEVELANAMLELLSNKQLCDSIAEKAHLHVVEAHNIERFTEYFRSISSPQA